MLMNSGALIALAAILLPILRMLFTTTTELVTWFGYARSVLELLYYLSGIAIAVAAFWGLKQLTISKQIARENAKREAYKLAADECRYYAKEIVPLMAALRDSITSKNLRSFTNRTFTVANGEITTHNFDLTLLQRELPQISSEIVFYLNAMEAFAIFFVSGVASEEIGYRETGTAFCGGAQEFMPAIFMMRLRDIRFESIVRLFEIWNGRQHAEKIATQMKALEDAAKRVNKETIRPIGT
jgi:hypothetical protein